MNVVMRGFEDAFYPACQRKNIHSCQYPQGNLLAYINLNGKPILKRPPYDQVFPIHVADQFRIINRWLSAMLQHHLQAGTDLRINFFKSGHPNFHPDTKDALSASR